MAKYRKKRVFVEAEQFFYGVTPWPAGVIYVRPLASRPEDTYIETPEGLVRVREGDWIVTGGKGERYPWTAEKFEATYELLEDPADAMAERV